MNDNNKIIVFLYNRLFDPLVQSNFWLYIDDYLERHDVSFSFHVVSYEDVRYPVTSEQKEKFEQWHSFGLEWTPLQWHPGTGLQNKLIDILTGLAIVLKLRFRGYRHIVSYGSIASAYAYLYGRILGMRLFIHTFEPHSEYAAESGMWNPGGLMYRAAHLLERRAAEFAVALASGTRFMENRLQDEWRVRGRFFKIPSVADDRKFHFDQDIRDATRTALNLSVDQWVLFYPGKFGGLYYKEETALMFRWLYELESRLHFLLVTPHSDEEIHAIFDHAGVDRESYTVVHCEYPDIHRYYFAADFGVIAVPPTPSKKFTSNIKVGEYLCAGLPFLITRGVSEDYWYAENRKVGVVVDDFKEKDIKGAWPEMKEYLEMDSEKRRAHCREVGLEYRGFANLNPVFKAAIDELTA